MEANGRWHMEADGGRIAPFLAIKGACPYNDRDCVKEEDRSAKPGCPAKE